MGRPSSLHGGRSPALALAIRPSQYPFQARREGAVVQSPPRTPTRPARAAREPLEQERPQPAGARRSARLVQFRRRRPVPLAPVVSSRERRVAGRGVLLVGVFWVGVAGIPQDEAPACSCRDAADLPAALALLRTHKPETRHRHGGRSTPQLGRSLDANDLSGESQPGRLSFPNWAVCWTPMTCRGAARRVSCAGRIAFAK